MIRRLRSLSIVIFLLVIFLLITGCFKSNEGNNERTQETNDTLNKLQAQLKSIKEELRLSETHITSLELENEKLKEKFIQAENHNVSLDNYVKQLSDEYQNVYFDICTEVEHSWCSRELKYFDPRLINVGEKLFGMMISSISVGEFDPGSYIVSLSGSTTVTGNYTLMKDDVERGDYYRFETTKINGQDRNLVFSIGLKPIEYKSLLETFKDDKGNASIIIQSLTLMRLPHKPGYNSAEFIGLDK